MAWVIVVFNLDVEIQPVTLVVGEERFVTNVVTPAELIVDAEIGNV